MEPLPHMPGSLAQPVLAGGEGLARFRSKSLVLQVLGSATAKAPQHHAMAGIKNKSAAADAPARVKKDKSEKKSSKSDSKHAVKSAKPAKKSKKVADDLEESDTSEQENGYNGFSANPDTEMVDSDSEGQSKTKTQKRKAEDEPTDKKKKSKYETPKEISSKLADMHGKHMPAYVRLFFD